jgi:hypothetical protein
MTRRRALLLAVLSALGVFSAATAIADDSTKERERETTKEQSPPGLEGRVPPRQSWRHRRPQRVTRGKRRRDR